MCRRRRLWIAVACTALLACGEKERQEEAGDERAPPPGAEPVPAAEAPPPPLAGPLTVEALLAAKRGVKPYDEWSAAWTHLSTAAGKPTRVDGDLHGWYVLSQGACFVLEVVRDAAEDRVDSVLYGPFEREASQFARCAP